MDYPNIITHLPAADIPFSDSQVKTHVLPSAHGMLIFFDFFQDIEIPAHSHGGQWGTVLAGAVEMIIDQKTRHYTTGDTYFIPSGTVHEVHIKAGTKAIDFFEESDRYSLR